MTTGTGASGGGRPVRGRCACRRGGGAAGGAEVTDVKVVILRLSRVSTIDATGALVLRDVVERLEHRGIAVLVSGIKPGHERVLHALGGADRLRERGRVFASTPEAIKHARTLLETRVRNVREFADSCHAPPDPDDRASSVFNLTALIAADCGMPSLATELSKRLLQV